MFRLLRAIKTYRRLNRYREVIFTLLKYGFDDIVDRIGPEFIFRRGFLKRDRSKADLPTPARVRFALEDLGPTFIKFGQLLSTRPDILPDDYLKELEKLQDDVPSFSYEEVRRIFREELEGEPDQLFMAFEETPIASGSIAQVHRATLSDGRRVAVKVQRPKIRRVIETDLAILEEITGLFERNIPELRWFRPRDLVRQFAATIRRELDFIAEGHAAERFRHNFEAHPSFFVPAVYWELTSLRILTTELVEGVKITNFQEIEARGYDKQAIARNGARAILKEVFEDRFFHGDPHPGNFFVLEGNVIAAVDFGIVGRLDEEMSERIATLASAIIHRDVEKIIQVFRKMEILREDVDQSLLKFDVLEFIDTYHGLTLDKIEAEQILQDLFEIVRRHRMTLPVSLAMMGRMLVVSAGVGRMLDPDFDMIGEARPYVESFMMRRLDPRKQLRGLTGVLQGYRDVIKSLPGDLEEIIAKVKKGKMMVALHHEGLNRFIVEIDRSSNRLTFGLIIASLIVGSSLVMQLDRGPMVYGFSALGLIGYLIAGILGLWLVLAILRSGKI